MTTLPIEKLIEVARASSKNAHCCYSDFPVGAGLLTDSGEVLPGCNVENMSYGLTNCAERTALFAAISQGYKPHSFPAIAIYTPTQTIVTPCGACRQVMSELMDKDAVVVSQCASGLQQQWTVGELLPDSFVF
ncbi:cytidine deaminase [Echinimonas agarilytica]|uniref:Cytidine deaminase n=1 Tax=Echinimonas agarilytica TaxID=1215918 RepID=A0AA42B7L8_9GAMM|nr:cytidine deaminase [Echinimonas agarilytica]MCM2679553.1 cytidine deaminase [Echinimonas agarilytica]